MQAVASITSSSTRLLVSTRSHAGHSVARFRRYGGYSLLSKQLAGSHSADTRCREDHCTARRCARGAVDRISHGLRLDVIGPRARAKTAREFCTVSRRLILRTHHLQWHRKVLSTTGLGFTFSLHLTGWKIRSICQLPCRTSRLRSQ